LPFRQEKQKIKAEGAEAAEKSHSKVKILCGLCALCVEALRARARITWHFVAARGVTITLWPSCFDLISWSTSWGPQPCGARRRTGICGVAAPRRCHHITCVATPCICPPGARAKMPTYSCAGP
jgi:hypothetical protein